MPRSREQIMNEWDGIRAKIAAGCTNSGPRDWLEGVLDDLEQELTEARRIAKQWHDVVALNIQKSKR